MIAPHYYNEWDQYAAEWLRNLIAAGHLPAGEVDNRSIADVQPDDLAGFRQCHFFAGIGGWALAARLAGWPDERELWTGSCPCQPFSVAGKGAGTDDERHLWPHQLRLIRARRPAVWMGEQVASAVGHGWLDGVLADLEGIGYAGRAAVVPACAVDAPHRRDRLWIVTERSRAVDHGIGARLEGLARHGYDSTGWAQQDRPVAEAGSGGDVADTSGRRCGEPGSGEVQQPGRAEVVGGGEACALAHAHGVGGQVDPNAGGRKAGSGAREVAGLVCGSDGDVAHADSERSKLQERAERNAGSAERDLPGRYSARSEAGWIIGHDGKARRVEPGIRLLAHGVPARVGRLRAYGNAIVPQVAAEVIAAYMECRP